MRELYDDNPEIVGGFLEEVYKDEQNFKKTWGNQAKRNIAFVNGDQNPWPAGSPVMVNNQPVNYIYTTDTRTNTYMSNEIEPIIRTLVSYMTRQKPTVDVVPATQDEQDKHVAEVGERINEAKYDLDREYEVSQMVARWALTIGTVYVKDYWDSTSGEEHEILGPDGQPTKMAAGNNKVQVLTPLSITCDNSITNFHDQPYLIETYLMDVEEAKELFDQQGPGYTGKAPLISEDGWAGDTLGILEDIKFAVPYVSSGAGYRVRGKNKCVVKECYIKPNKKFPKGQLLIRAGGQWVYLGRETGSPYYLQLEDEVWHPYEKFGYESYMGRYLDKSLVEQLISLQIRLNEINGAILENANTIAKPNICAAARQLKKGVLNGRGANVYTYKAIAGVSPPFVLQGAPLPEQFFKEKQSIIDSMVRIAATNFIMQGQTPQGVTAAQALQLLLENASSQHSDLMLSWEKFHERRYTKKLRLLHKFHQFPDQKIDNYIAQFTKDMLDTTVKDFVGVRDLSDGIVCKIQYGSMIPKSNTAKKDIYKEFAKEGLLGPVQEDSPRGAKLRDQLMERLGEESFDTDESVEVKKAKWENDRMLKGGASAGLPVEVSPYDNGKIHLAYHIAKVQDPKFLETASDPIKEEFFQHISATQEQEAKKEAQAQMAMAQMQQGQQAGAAAGGAKQNPPVAPPAAPEQPIG